MRKSTCPLLASEHADGIFGITTGSRLGFSPTGYTQMRTTDALCQTSSCRSLERCTLYNRANCIVVYCHFCFAFRIGKRFRARTLLVCSFARSFACSLVRLDSHSRLQLESFITTPTGAHGRRQSLQAKNWAKGPDEAVTVRVGRKMHRSVVLHCS